jgi:hypothetical protein
VGRAISILQYVLDVDLGSVSAWMRANAEQYQNALEIIIAEMKLPHMTRLED